MKPKYTHHEEALVVVWVQAGLLFIKNTLKMILGYLGAVYERNALWFYLSALTWNISLTFVHCSLKKKILS